MSRVLLAPDKLKGTLTAVEAAAALAAGWRRVRPDDEVELRPMADGGDGTASVLAEVVPGSYWREVLAEDAVGSARLARYLLQPGAPTAGDQDGDGPTAVVELAEVCGIAGLAELQPMTAHTTGLGIVLRAAVEAGARRIVVAPAGSASTDGGIGALIALGAVAFVTDPLGGESAFVPGVHPLTELVRISLDSLVPPPPDGVDVLVDVDAVLTGPHGAAAVFGPQKGASTEQVAELDAGLRHLAALLPPGMGDPQAPGAGAAGGAAFGLACWGARLVPGAPTVAGLIGLPAALAVADLVITAEGRFDETSLTGKACGYVLESAEGASVPAYVVGGAIADGVRSGNTISLTELAGSSGAALEQPGHWLSEAAAVLAAECTILGL